MGKTNRQRRREKQLRRARASQSRSTKHQEAAEQSAPGRKEYDAGVVKEVVVAAATAVKMQDHTSYEKLVDCLQDIGEATDGRRLIDHEVDACLGAAVALAWRRGWQPADVARLADRQLGPTHSKLLVDAIALDRCLYEGRAVDPRWQAQLDELSASVWWEAGRSHFHQWQEREGAPLTAVLACALELLALLWHIPTLPRLGPLPGEEPTAQRPARRGRAVDSRMLSRVRALLAKAESTTFPEEAEALSTKAQELMARHMIDSVMLQEATGESAAEGPVGVRLSVDDPYASAKSQLLSGVARANRCRAVYSPDLGFSTVFGHEIDIDTVELLYSSLLVQATSAMVAAGSQVDLAGRSRTRSFRHSFLLAYAARISARLREANRATVAEAEGGTNLLPVLASRELAVDDALAKVFPHLTQHRVSASNSAGWAAGTVAADLASLSTTRAEVGSEH